MCFFLTRPRPARSTRPNSLCPDTTLCRTFAVSAIERVIEGRARGDAGKAAEVRGRLEERIGGSIRSVVPGSGDAATLKQALIDDGMWSQYLEVAIGPD